MAVTQLHPSPVLTDVRGIPLGTNVSVSLSCREVQNSHDFSWEASLWLEGSRRPIDRFDVGDYPLLSNLQVRILLFNCAVDLEPFARQDSDLQDIWHNVVEAAIVAHSCLTITVEGEDVFFSLRVGNDEVGTLTAPLDEVKDYLELPESDVE